ncbi:WXG100 family type VII secretion target [Catenulispora sp. GP43]|uniref:WXG100 family type VII secretion target n=1 Tax=Catenulispora sp. GP43 TaxID=3156263 RepID=UPI003511041E
MTTSVDVQGMQLAQQDFQQALDQMNSVYSAMTEEADNLSASWSGMAASAFGQALQAWLDDLYQIRQELVVMTESLSTHTGIYSDANETSQDVVTAFQQGLQGLESLPAEPMVALRSTEAPLLPEKGVLARRMAVEGKVLPAQENVVRLRNESVLPALRDSVEGTPQGFISSQVLPAHLDREEAFLPGRQLEDVPEEPLLPEEPLMPAQFTLPEEPLRPTELILPEEPLRPTLRDRSATT